MSEQKCKKCGEGEIYISGLCEDCYQLQLMDYAVSEGKDVFVTYDGKKLYK